MTRRPMIFADGNRHVIPVKTVLTFENDTQHLFLPGT